MKVKTKAAHLDYNEDIIYIDCVLPVRSAIMVLLIEQNVNFIVQYIIYISWS